MPCEKRFLTESLRGSRKARLARAFFYIFNRLRMRGATSAISAQHAATTDKPIGSVLTCATPPISTGPISKPK
jgi:hypothetical protein